MCHGRCECVMAHIWSETVNHDVAVFFLQSQPATKFAVCKMTIELIFEKVACKPRSGCDICKLHRGCDWHICMSPGSQE